MFNHDAERMDSKDLPSMKVHARKKRNLDQNWTPLKEALALIPCKKNNQRVEESLRARESFGKFLYVVLNELNSIQELKLYTC